MTKVQILIPAYNSEGTIGDTIDSLLKQTYKNIDILVVDNCSTDNTCRVVESFKSQNVKCISNDRNLGNYGNFDKCISLSAYDYTAIFHADDIYLPSMIEEQVKILDKYPNVGAVFTESEKVDQDLVALGHIKTPWFSGGKELNGVIYFNFEKLLKAIIHNNCFLMCPSAMVRSNIYKNEIKDTRVGYFGDAADVDVWLRISMNWNIAIIKKKLMKYRKSVHQHTYRINKNRLARGEYALLANYYRLHYESILRNSNHAIKREKIIDLIIRLSATDKNSKKRKKFAKVIICHSFDFRLLVSLRYWRYVLYYLLGFSKN